MVPDTLLQHCASLYCYARGEIMVIRVVGGNGALIREPGAQQHWTARCRNMRSRCLTYSKRVTNGQPANLSVCNENLCCRNVESRSLRTPRECQPKSKIKLHSSFRICHLYRPQGRQNRQILKEECNLNLQERPINRSCN